MKRGVSDPFRNDGACGRSKIPAVSRARTPAAKEARRGEILRAASALFGEASYPEVTVAGVAERAGLAKGSVYHYFRSKEELFLHLVLDRLSHKVTRAGMVLPLQPREYRLLEYLMRHAGQVVTRTMLLENVWDYHFDPQTNVIDVHISRLRRKVDKGFESPLIHTVRGAGYKLSESA